MAPHSGLTLAASRAFFDTNILVYADDSGEPAKRSRALELIETHRQKRTGVVSIQVLQEYYVTATGKYGIDPALAKSKVEVFSRFQVVEPSIADVLAAIDLHRLTHLSFWDALIIRSAKQGGCSVLLTEDMQHGQVIDGVRVVNPFM